MSILQYLPEDLLVAIFSLCDIKSLGKLSQVCKKFHHLIKHNSVWKRHYYNLSCVHYSCPPGEFYNKSKRGSHIPLREFCRLSLNWKLWAGETKVIKHYDRQLPWIMLDCYGILWVSNKNFINSYNLSINKVHDFPNLSFKCDIHDVNRFAMKRNVLFAGYRDGSAACYNKNYGQLEVYMKRIHNKEIQAVDIIDDDFVVTGSFDETVKVLNRHFSHNVIRTLPLFDRVLSLASFSHQKLAVGTAGVKHFPSPISIWDLHTGDRVTYVGCNFKHGAGILDMKKLDSHVLATADYNSSVKIWDLRQPLSSAITLEDLSDSPVYCIAPDYRNSLISGSARGSQSSLWDMRSPRKPVQVYHFRCSSPVYSLAFNPTSLFMALDECLVRIKF